MTATLKFSVVTPTRNSARFIGETIESVISQAGNFSIEYIIQDGGSTDGTQEIVRSYQRLLKENCYPIQCAGVVISWHSGEDEGMYDAINRGFEVATGDICAYINSDDVYLPGAFSTMAAVFTRFPEIKWVKGISSYMSGDSTICSVDCCHLYAQEWIAKGVYGRWLPFINQEAVFWRLGLWEQCGGVDRSLKVAGDYYLWTVFARNAPLVSVKAYVSCFRVVEGQLSSNMSAYRNEMDRVCPPSDKLKKSIQLESLARKVSSLRWIMPNWMRLYFIKLLILLDKKKYYAVEISTNIDLQYFEGDYYSVSGKLLWQSALPTPR